MGGTNQSESKNVWPYFVLSGAMLVLSYFIRPREDAKIKITHYPLGKYEGHVYFVPKEDVDSIGNCIFFPYESEIVTLCSPEDQFISKDFDS